MVYYINFLFIILLMALAESFFNQEKSAGGNLGSYHRFITSKIFLKYSFFLSFLLLWLIGALRYEVGVDYGHYLSNQIPRVLGGEFSAVEPLGAIIFIVGAWMGDYQYIFVIIHFIIMYFVLKSIFQQSVNYTFSIFLLFFTGFFNTSLNLMRQTVAISLFLYGIKFIYQKNFKKYFTAIIFAAMFHITALFFYTPIYFFYEKKASKKNIVGMIILIAISSLIFESILYFVTRKLGLFVNYWGAREMSVNQNNFSPTHFFLNISVLIVMLILRQLAVRNKVEISKKIDFAIFLQLMPLAVMLFAYVTYFPNFDRVIIMYSFAQVLTLPEFFALPVNKSIKSILFIFICSLYIFTFYWLIVAQNIGGTFPYQTIFSR